MLYFQLRNRHRCALACALFCLLSASCRRRAHLNGSDSEDTAAVVRIIDPISKTDLVRAVSATQPLVVYLRGEQPVRNGPSHWFGDRLNIVPESLGEKKWDPDTIIGNGILIGRSRDILTTYSLVAGQKAIYGHIGSLNKAYRTSLVGYDEASDIALLHIEEHISTELPRLPPIIPPKQVRAGEWVFVLSNPLGLGIQVGVGVVSSQYRINFPIAKRGGIAYLQTTLKLHPGNRGGPVFTASGECLGLATTVSPETSGIGFVLPLASAKKLLPLLRRGGAIQRAWIGAYVDDIATEDISRLGASEIRGAIVRRVIAQGPAERAGLRVDDIIVTFDGAKVDRASVLPWRAIRIGPKRWIKLGVWRNGNHETLSLRTEAMPN